MKNKRNEGFSLVEVLVAIALLGVILVPTCSALVMSLRMNGKTDAMMHAQLAVSSAVETLMAEGIEKASDKYDIVLTAGGGEVDLFPYVSVETKAVYAETDPEEAYPYYTVTVTSNDGTVAVTTIIRESGEDGE